MFERLPVRLLLASEYSVSALSATSKYPKISSIGKEIQSPGIEDRGDDLGDESNVSMSSTRVVAREASGVTR